MKNTFLALIAAVVMLPLFSACEKEDKNEPSTPAQKEVVKIVVTGEAEYDCVSGASKVDIASKVELTNNNGIVHTYAAKENEYHFSVEYPASATEDKYVLSFTADAAKVDTSKTYDIEFDIDDIKITKYFSDGTSSVSEVPEVKKQHTVKGSALNGKTIKTTKEITF